LATWRAISSVFATASETLQPLPPWRKRATSGIATWFPMVMVAPTRKVPASSLASKARSSSTAWAQVASALTRNARPKSLSVSRFPRRSKSVIAN